MAKPPSPACALHAQFAHTRPGCCWVFRWHVCPSVCPAELHNYRLTKSTHGNFSSLSICATTFHPTQGRTHEESPLHGEKEPCSLHTHPSPPLLSSPACSCPGRSLVALMAGAGTQASLSGQDSYCRAHGRYSHCPLGCPLSLCQALLGSSAAASSPEPRRLWLPSPSSPHLPATKTNKSFLLPRIYQPIKCFPAWKHGFV